MSIRALSLHQPWASAVAIGAKKVETRSWSTSYRGPLAIHATVKRDYCDFTFFERPLLEAFAAKGIKSIDDLPFGCIVATCELTRCVATAKIRDSLGELDRLLGGYEDGRFAWVLNDVRPLPRPVPWRGSQGFFNVELPDFQG